ncbi:MAG: hypothetical protein M1339_06945, partial [Bacteroidetes bacterium]|nr:hypothetical protein [Bacteroidota bacterium]
MINKLRQLCKLRLTSKVSRSYPVLALLLALSGCTKHFSSNLNSNIPPKTYVSASPYRDSTQSASFNSQPSLLDIHWWANDPDGL